MKKHIPIRKSDKKNPTGNIIQYLSYVAFFISVVEGLFLTATNNQFIYLLIFLIVGGISAVFVYGFGEIIIILDDIRNTEYIETEADEKE